MLLTFYCFKHQVIPRCFHSALTTGSIVYMAGGRYSDGSLSREMWRYDYSCDSWEELAPMNEAHTDYGKTVKV